ncbi:unnamed protein product [Amoebophrya sp. A120]|nr:unnamed protein product [Amoebophrya sp. A120]|eukprot:GSA120T00010915001.1
MRTLRKEVIRGYPAEEKLARFVASSDELVQGDSTSRPEEPQESLSSTNPRAAATLTAAGTGRSTPVIKINTNTANSGDDSIAKDHYHLETVLQFTEQDLSRLTNRKVKNVVEQTKIGLMHAYNVWQQYRKIVPLVFRKKHVVDLSFSTTDNLIVYAIEDSNANYSRTGKENLNLPEDSKTQAEEKAEESSFISGSGGIPVVLREDGSATFEDLSKEAMRKMGANTQMMLGFPTFVVHRVVQKDPRFFEIVRRIREQDVVFENMNEPDERDFVFGNMEFEVFVQNRDSTSRSSDTSIAGTTTTSETKKSSTGTIKPQARLLPKQFSQDPVFLLQQEKNQLQLEGLSMADIHVKFLRLAVVEREAGLLSNVDRSNSYMLMNAKGMIHAAYYKFEDIARYDPWRYAAVRPPPDLQYRLRREDFVLPKIMTTGTEQSGTEVENKSTSQQRTPLFSGDGQEDVVVVPTDDALVAPIVLSNEDDVTENKIHAKNKKTTFGAYLQNKMRLPDRKKRDHFAEPRELWTWEKFVQVKLKSSRSSNDGYDEEKSTLGARPSSSSSVCSIEHLFGPDFDHFKGVYPPLKWDKVLFKYMQDRFVRPVLEEKYTSENDETKSKADGAPSRKELDYRDPWRKRGQSKLSEKSKSKNYAATTSSGSTSVKKPAKKNWVINFGAADGACGYLYSWNHDLANCLLVGSVFNNWPLNYNSTTSAYYEAWSTHDKGQENHSAGGGLRLQKLEVDVDLLQDATTSSTKHLFLPKKDVPNIPVFNISGLVVEADLGNKRKLRREFARNHNVVYFLNMLQLHDIKTLMDDMVFRENFSTSPVLFKLDIDNIDCEMMDRVLNAGVRPLVIFVESVNNYPVSIRKQAGDVSLLANKEPAGTMFELATSGCSLSGFIETGLKYDYFLVEVLNDDAVFVRKDMFFDPDFYEREDEVFVEKVDVDVGLENVVDKEGPEVGSSTTGSPKKTTASPGADERAEKTKGSKKAGEQARVDKAKEKSAGTDAPADAESGSWLSSWFSFSGESNADTAPPEPDSVPVGDEITKKQEKDTEYHPPPPAPPSTTASRQVRELSAAATIVDHTTSGLKLDFREHFDLNLRRNKNQHFSSYSVLYTHKERDLQLQTEPTISSRPAPPPVEHKAAGTVDHHKTSKPSRYRRRSRSFERLYGTLDRYRRTAEFLQHSGYTCHPMRHANGMESRLVDVAGPGDQVTNYERMQIIGAVEDSRWRAENPYLWTRHHGNRHLFELEETVF